MGSAFTDCSVSVSKVPGDNIPCGYGVEDKFEESFSDDIFFIVIAFVDLNKCVFIDAVHIWCIDGKVT